MEMVIFLTYVIIRAFHPVVIGESKTAIDENGKKSYPYQSGSLTMTMAFSTCIFFLAFCYLKGGPAQFKSIFNREPLIIFSINGAVYALGDFLEMNSLGGLPAATYSIIQQFRIVVAALLLMPVKGQYQTRMQWTILMILVFGMSTYMCIGNKDSSSGGGDSSGMIVGFIFALSKVLVSCSGAVITDKYMKKYKEDPTHVCIARSFMAWSLTLFILSLIPRVFAPFTGAEVKDMYAVGFFNGWDTMTVVTLVSFTIKTVSTLYIVALLDSILKNIAESFAILVIYGYDIIAPWVDKSFDAAAFMSVLVVVAACLAYIDSKAAVEKAANWEKMQADAASSA